MALTLHVNVTLFPVIPDTGETVVTTIAAENIVSNVKKNNALMVILFSYETLEHFVFH